jgi:SOS-response transcriptional repressor LexA
MQHKKTQKAEIILNALRKHYNLRTYGDLAEFLGVPLTTLSSWKARNSINEDMIYAKCVGISAEWLKTGEGEMFASPSITPPGNEAPRPRGLIITNEIPVLGRISAGFPNVATEEIIEYISIPGTPENSFALVVKGASMEPSFRDGDYVIFVDDGDYRINDVLIVLNEWGEAMVKRLKEKGGKRYLVSDNPAYPVVEPNEHFRIIGKVVKGWRDLKF